MEQWRRGRRRGSLQSVLEAERCQSGRSGRSRKPLTLRGVRGFDLAVGAAGGETRPGGRREWQRQGGAVAGFSARRGSTRFGPHLAEVEWVARRGLVAGESSSGRAGRWLASALAGAARDSARYPSLSAGFGGGFRQPVRQAGEMSWSSGVAVDAVDLYNRFWKRRGARVVDRGGLENR